MPPLAIISTPTHGWIRTQDPGSWVHHCCPRLCRSATQPEPTICFRNRTWHATQASSVHHSVVLLVRYGSPAEKPPPCSALESARNLKMHVIESPQIGHHATGSVSSFSLSPVQLHPQSCSTTTGSFGWRCQARFTPHHHTGIF
jgi:hypothetical protein